MIQIFICVVLVTGAGKGIGRDVCLLLHERGAKVIALSRTKEDLESLQQEIPCEIVQADLEDCANLKEAVTKLGAIDLLVNNAAIALLEPFLETSVENFDKTFNVNVRQILVVSQIVAKGMIERGKGGAIVNVSSQASMVALKDHTSYCVSKGALDQLTRSMVQFFIVNHS
eukprot:TRINITY_DN2886_c0_g1_i2.p1 TRINITY_DN2886_c0_g1~~TRINITY_DN2886_c0_g1_i2.p1  ORF type:complete len:171 (-),score=45.22 TRINITY_DN2886_c0_g1_i2:55-567(-)